MSGREVGLLQESDDLALNLGLDSLQLVELQANLESALSIRLAAQDLVALRTIGDILDVIETRDAN